MRTGGAVTESPAGGVASAGPSLPARPRPFLGRLAAVVATGALLAAGEAVASGADPIDVCADAAGQMRLVAVAVACGPDERRLRLSGPESRRRCEKPRYDLARLEAQVAALERAVVARPQNSRVVAPFEVFDEAGVRVFSVRLLSAATAGSEFHDETGRVVASIGANQSGGLLRVNSGKLEATIEAAREQAVIETRSGFGGFLLGRSDSGRYALEMLRSGYGKRVAALGESIPGSGLAEVADAEGTPRASMSVPQGTGAGLIMIRNEGEVPVAYLYGSGPGKSGLLQLTNSSGEVMVEAGMAGTGIGRVRAGPDAFRHGIMFLGLPASYIEGRR